MIGDLEAGTGIVRYTAAHADELCTKLRTRMEKLGGSPRIIRTDLFLYARELGVMIAYADRPGYREVRISGQTFDPIDMADKILAADI